MLYLYYHARAFKKPKNLRSVVKMNKLTSIKSTLSCKIIAYVRIRQFMQFRFYLYEVVYVMVLAFR